MLLTLLPSPPGSLLTATPDSALLDEFLSHLSYERGLSANTIDAYRRDIEGYSAFISALGATLLSAGLAEARAFIDMRLSSGDSAATIARRAASIRSLHKFLVREGIAEEYRLSELRTPKHYGDSWQVAGGVRVHGLAAAPGLELLVGGHYDRTPAPPETLTLDQPTFNHVGLHSGLRWAFGRYRLGATYLHATSTWRPRRVAAWLATALAALALAAAVMSAISLQ